ncbi:ABC transporter ATP-binding protein [Rathayibacter iranicus]|uniref:ABC transporter ATP-binding protein n=2 Tax=Rathayibacter iranicus TaxID=59737 RepID=A0AAD2JG65_9MICO|nr:ABC transporter ATP-binding protein [Rathayibacter iranicus]AZZ55142.1 ABC transporter ATP-binding protein [Rathayibacter iranicus]MWV32375.1 ATP-binding cassette domain-containing protein [Rathayibacter iranicus NCPPB 2253 = VKM Ac-1602]PPI49456.1 multidrug ABC transporter ATP-binding protein [Rathayibacter iranicus]PPI61821.1 multidrug ABC transporter ATP-binding protein [Rathayibacter iranicus]PPI73396.1 multidrug ABC transporter ATP-binding protein [Rathayibacter iranicus]
MIASNPVSPPLIDHAGHEDSAASVTGLVVEYGRARAVDGIDFSVRRGEVFGLLGTNGAGKTTTLDVLEGFRAPTQGSVRVLGADPLADHDRIAPRLGIMLQDAGFFEDLTVAQTLAAWRRFHSHPRTVGESLDLVGLDNRARIRVKQLSGGERRRLDLALALLGNPDVLFLDEPTTGMDPEGRRRSLEIVRSLVDEGLTVILTTHYLDEAEQLADRVAIMHRGTIRVQGTLGEVLASHRTSTVSFETTALGTQLEELLHGCAAEVRPSPGSSAVSFASTSPQADLTRLLECASRLSLELDAITVSHSSLEDLFLTLASEADPDGGGHR